jgi:iron uptake system component EfeO
MSVRVPFRSSPIVAIAAAAVVVGACGSGAGQPSGQPGGTAATGPVVEVQATEFAFAPATLSVPSGSVTFRVTNGGQAEHEFELFRGEAVVDEIEGLVPGLARDLTVTLEPGSYTYVCKLANHDTLGMKGTLTVSG